MHASFSVATLKEKCYVFVFETRLLDIYHIYKFFLLEAFGIFRHGNPKPDNFHSRVSQPVFLVLFM